MKHLEAAIAGLSECIANLNIDNASLRAENAELEDKVGELDRAFDVLFKQNAELRERLAEAERQRGAWEHNYIHAVKYADRLKELLAEWVAWGKSADLLLTKYKEYVFEDSETQEAFNYIEAAELLPMPKEKP